MGVDPDEDEYASDDEPTAQASVFFFRAKRRGEEHQQNKENITMENSWKTLATE